MTLEAGITDQIDRMKHRRVPASEGIPVWLELSDEAQGHARPSLELARERYLELMDFWKNGPIEDPEDAHWATYNGPIEDRFGGAVGIDDPVLLGSFHADDLALALAVRRAKFKQRVLDGVALREGGEVGDRFLNEADMGDDKAHWRMSLRRLRPDELNDLDPRVRDTVDGMRLVVSRERREVVLVTDHRDDGFSAMEAVRAMVRCPDALEHGYAVRVVVVVFMDTEHSDPFLANPYELVTLTHYAPEHVVLVGCGEAASKALEQAVKGGEDTIAALLGRAIEVFSHWRREDDPKGRQLEGWTTLAARALHEDHLRHRASPFDALKEALSRIPLDARAQLGGEHYLYLRGLLRSDDREELTRRLSFKHNVFEAQPEA